LHYTRKTYATQLEVKKSSMSTASFFQAARDLLDRIESTQHTAIERASRLIAECLLQDGLWYLFGSGHSALGAEEVYYRAGGLVPVVPLRLGALQPGGNPLLSSHLERLPGVGRILVEQSPISDRDVLTVLSNSGKNAVPVEAALCAKERGVKTIAITSLAHAQSVTADPRIGKKLHEVCDVVIDTCGVPGDASLPLPRSGDKICPTSTLANVAILQEIVYRVCLRIEESGRDVPFFKSANSPGGDEWNRRWIERYREKGLFRW
jgi:uncharacterized phosphosugar-binding protein